ncbi:hypothetical protein [Sphaerisporangium corydalis]|uniref:Uncharacterized protein n=1 Tax=Sphaerisporangium corydalis TaxID=1441875 RepID=A0ABV9ESD1_9ACTN|nr:hypothetical protein [Sphaerisporangium corydalis]
MASTRKSAQRPDSSSGVVLPARKEGPAEPDGGPGASQRRNTPPRVSEGPGDNRLPVVLAAGWY